MDEVIEHVVLFLHGLSAKLGYPLHEELRGEKLRVWFAPEDMQGGQKLSEPIDRAIQVNDRLLLVLSEHSLNSEWVKTEIRKARQAARQRPSTSSRKSWDSSTSCPSSNCGTI